MNIEYVKENNQGTKQNKKEQQQQKKTEILESILGDLTIFLLFDHEYNWNNTMSQVWTP